MQVRPRPHLVACWHDLVRSQRNPNIPASTNRLEGGRGRLKPRVHLPRGLKTEAGALNFVGPTRQREPRLYRTPNVELRRLTQKGEPAQNESI